MIECYFTNLENIAIGELKKAQNSIKAAVAWINFDIYGCVFEELLNRRVKIELLINNDDINKRYIDQINYLNNRGADIRLVNFAGIMHHKFCVIDEYICMFGSFNWTKNANVKNIENLNICDDITVVHNYLLEFGALSNLSKSDIRLLKSPKCCNICSKPIVNILLMELENEYQTKVIVLRQCDCDQEKVYEDYYDVSLYNNFVEFTHRFDEEIEIALNTKDESSFNRIVAERDFAVANYLSFVRTNRMGMPLIHAIGVKRWEDCGKDEGDYVYKVIWKERGTNLYIPDRYEIF